VAEEESKKALLGGRHLKEKYHGANRALTYMRGMPITHKWGKSSKQGGRGQKEIKKKDGRGKTQLPRRPWQQGGGSFPVSMISRKKGGGMKKEEGARETVLKPGDRRLRVRKGKYNHLAIDCSSKKR